VDFGRRIALVSVVVNVLLSAGNITVGLLAGSTSATAAGVEFGADVVASGLVYAGLYIAAQPPDQNHPYGHGRAETLSGLIIGVLLLLTGIGICTQSLRNYSLQHPPPSSLPVWSLIGAIIAKLALMTAKFRVGRRIRSAALVSDAWNDAVDILSGGTALAALALTLYNPERFLSADHFGGFAVGLIVVTIGLRIGRDTSLELMDTMPAKGLMDSIRAQARRVQGVEGVEKCWARKTGLRYHIDLHLEVKPSMSVAESHSVAEQVRQHIRRELPEVADVLVHVEPAQAPPPDPLVVKPSQPGNPGTE
jgi:cation diffusion facilitator family transporter